MLVFFKKKTYRATASRRYWAVTRMQLVNSPMQFTVRLQKEWQCLQGARDTRHSLAGHGTQTPSADMSKPGWHIHDCICREPSRESDMAGHFAHVMLSCL
jgi:hypothetical protein